MNHMASLTQLLGKFEGMDTKELPLDQWHPEHCGEIDIKISADGTWYHQGDPIKRERLVRLFSRVLRREDDNEYYLVTPVEKLRIQVEDVPFLAVLMETSADPKGIRIITNVGDEVDLGPDHPMELRPFGHPPILLPYIKIRNQLWARVNRSLYYELIKLAEEHQGAQGVESLVESHGEFYSLGRFDE